MEGDDKLVINCGQNDSRAAAVARQAGTELYLKGMFKEAILQFEKACGLERSNTVNFELCASSMIKLGQYGEARGKLRRSIEINPYSAKTHSLQCRLAMAKAGVEELSNTTDINLLRELYLGFYEAEKLDSFHETTAAERRMEVEKILKAIKSDLPSFKTGVSAELAKLRVQGIEYMKKKKYVDAFKNFKQCVDEEPENPENYALRSMVLAKITKKAKGNPAEMALRDAKRSLRMSAGYAKGWAALALAYARLDQLDYALEAWEECRRHDVRIVESFAKDREKLQKLVSKKGKSFTRRDIPWEYSETALALAGSEEQRAEPTLEMDSMGGMTIRSQFKRVLLSNANKPRHIDLSPRGDAPLSGSRAALRPVSPRPGNSVSPRPGGALRSPRGVAPATVPGTKPSVVDDQDEDEEEEPEGSGKNPAKAAPKKAVKKMAKNGSGMKVAMPKKVPQKAPSISVNNGKDADLERFCKLIGGKVTRKEAGMLDPEKDIPAGLSLPDKLFIRAFVEEVKK